MSFSLDLYDMLLQDFLVLYPRLRLPKFKRWLVAHVERVQLSSERVIFGVSLSIRGRMLARLCRLCRRVHAER